MDTENSLSKQYSLEVIESRPKAYKLMYDLSVLNNVEKEFSSILLPEKLKYWLGSHIFNATTLLNEDIVTILKRYKILFEKSLKTNVREIDDLFEDIKHNNFNEAIRKINKKRRLNAEYSSSVIVPLSDDDSFENQVNSILNQVFDFKDMEILFINNSNVDNQFIEDVKCRYDNVKFISNECSINKVIENSLSNYVIIQDVHNELTGTVGDLLKIIQKDKLDIVCQYDSTLDFNIRDIDAINDSQINSVIYNTDFLIDNEVKYELEDDNYTYFRKASSKTFNFRFINENSVTEICSLQKTVKFLLSCRFIMVKGT